jgi:hypothetical protein
MAVFYSLKLCLVASSIFTFAPGKSFAQKPESPRSRQRMNVGLGYVYLSAGIPMANRTSEQGVGASFTTDFTRRFGVKAEASYTLNFGAFGFPLHDDVLANLAGHG